MPDQIHWAPGLPKTRPRAPGGRREGHKPRRTFVRAASSWKVVARGAFGVSAGKDRCGYREACGDARSFERRLDGSETDGGEGCGSGDWQERAGHGLQGGSDGGVPKGEVRRRTIGKWANGRKGGGAIKVWRESAGKAEGREEGAGEDGWGQVWQDHATHLAKTRPAGLHDTGPASEPPQSSHCKPSPSPPPSWFRVANGSALRPSSSEVVLGTRVFFPNPPLPLPTSKPSPRNEARSVCVQRSSGTPRRSVPRVLDPGLQAISITLRVPSQTAPSPCPHPRLLSHRPQPLPSWPKSATRSRFGSSVDSRSRAANRSHHDDQVPAPRPPLRGVLLHRGRLRPGVSP